ncbi:class I SAM-dependent methyltransferase [Francisella sp. XLW-1]|uniref:class I SAM-dependent methyltransferase n=1 Tax=Francisella sp. XLW-1 TaxID=2610887 RepID=UPI00168D81DB|nr:class I SAM-dependent methyltransferase [Francisella sp. XLW-1]
MTQRNLDAEHYRNNSKIQLDLAHRAITLYSFAGDESILDVGCGDGRLTAYLSHKTSAQVVGIDPSRSMIGLAAKSFGKNFYKNLDFRLGAAEECTPDKYDLVTAFNCLHWVRDIEKSFVSIYNSLNDRGCFLFHTFPKEQQYFDVFKEVLMTPRWRVYANSAMHNYWLSSDEYRRLALDLGFVVIKENIEGSEAIYTTKDDFINYVRGWLQLYVKLPADAELSFIEDVANRASLKHSSGHGGCSIPYMSMSMLLGK